MTMNDIEFWLEQDLKEAAKSENIWAIYKLLKYHPDNEKDDYLMLKILFKIADIKFIKGLIDTKHFSYDYINSCKYELISISVDSNDFDKVKYIIEKIGRELENNAKNHEFIYWKIYAAKQSNQDKIAEYLEMFRFKKFGNKFFSKY